MERVSKRKAYPKSELSPALMNVHALVRACSRNFHVGVLCRDVSLPHVRVVHRRPRLDCGKS